MRRKDEMALLERLGTGLSCNFQQHPAASITEWKRKINRPTRPKRETWKKKRKRQEKKPEKKGGAAIERYCSRHLITINNSWFLHNQFVGKIKFAKRKSKQINRKHELKNWKNENLISVCSSWTIQFIKLRPNFYQITLDRFQMNIS